MRQQVFRQVDQQVRYKMEQQVGRQRAMDYCQTNAWTFNMVKDEYNLVVEI